MTANVDAVLDLPLNLLQPGEWADVTSVAGEPDWVGRMSDLGIRAGSRLRVVRPGSPCLIEVGAARLSLRGGTDGQILVRPLNGLLT